MATPRIRHILQVKNGKPVMQNREKFYEDLKRFEGRPCYFTLSELKRSRSNNQNRYYWGVVIEIIGRELGYHPEEVHEVLKNQFLPVRTLSIGDDEYKISGSTAKLSTKEFEDYLERVRTWAASNLSIVIPLPNEVDF